MLMRWWWWSSSWWAGGNINYNKKDDNSEHGVSMDTHHHKGMDHPTLIEDIEQQRGQEEYDLFDDW